MRSVHWLLLLAFLLATACVDRSRGRGGGGDDDDAFGDDDSAGDDDTGDDDTGDDDTGDDDTGDDDTGDDDTVPVGDDDHEPCADEARQLIYVIDHDYRLHSFHPVTHQFDLIGPLNCPAGSSWPEWGNIGAATPFSMSIDRQAQAWVLYSSGEIFRVSTQDASCTSTGFVPGQLSFKLFGMGFSSDVAGGDEDTLFISGGDFSPLLGTLDANNARLGSIQTTTMGVTNIGPVPSGEYTPELSGNGDGELYGYYPGFSSTIVRLDKQTGAALQSWPLPTSSGSVAAWAFANWGGRFYVFLSVGDFFSTSAHVYVFDPATGSYDQVLSNTGNVVVGAGVSTCAPISAE